MCVEWWAVQSEGACRQSLPTKEICRVAFNLNGSRKRRYTVSGFHPNHCLITLAPLTFRILFASQRDSQRGANTHVLLRSDATQFPLWTSFELVSHLVADPYSALDTQKSLIGSLLRADFKVKFDLSMYGPSGTYVLASLIRRMTRLKDFYQRRGRTNKNE